MYYVVQPGDTVNAIASRFGVPIRELIRVNGLTPPYIIYIGQTLYIPTTRPTPTPTPRPTPTPTPTPTPAPTDITRRLERLETRSTRMERQIRDLDTRVDRLEQQVSSILRQPRT